LLLRDTDYRAAVMRTISRRLPLGEVALVEQPASTAARAASARDSAAPGDADGAPRAFPMPR
ncbi:MAG: hypothetical protein ACRDID_10730, partial [Ktedonobacterales bacterium]